MQRWLSGDYRRQEGDGSLALGSNPILWRPFQSSAEVPGLFPVWKELGLWPCCDPALPQPKGNDSSLL